MKLVSFDIGIKNMAYCIFVIDTSNASILVQDWKVINIMNGSNTHDESLTTNSTTCGCQLKTKPSKKASLSKQAKQAVCGRKAIFTKTGQYYCAKHAKEHALDPSKNSILPQSSISTPSLKKLSKPALIELCKTWSIPALEGGYLKQDLLNHVVEWFSSRLFETILVKRTKTASETDLITLGRNMKTQLESIAEMEGATHVIMENQISPLAGRMKTIQGMLAQYYIMQNPSPHIEFISSSNKLKDFAHSNVDHGNPVLENRVIETPESKQGKDETKTMRQIYTQHKTDAVSFCRQLLTANPSMGSWTLDDPKKKDDLADCFLQGIWYMKHGKYILCAENLKINLV